ncbi:MAG: mevalonate kinase family protein [Candidatus Hodarchaeales archaeon]
MVNSKWPILEHRNIDVPKNLELMVGFTGSSASTRKLVYEMRLFKKNDPDYYCEIIGAIKNVTRQLIENLEHSQNNQKTLDLLDQNRLLLEELSMACSCESEIQAHRVMSQIAAKYEAVAKFSGAGGGDCSVGVCFDKNKAKSVLAEWQQHKIIPINISISEKGIRLES